MMVEVKAAGLARTSTSDILWYHYVSYCVFVSGSGIKIKKTVSNIQKGTEKIEQTRGILLHQCELHSWPPPSLPSASASPPPLSLLVPQMQRIL